MGSPWSPKPAAPKTSKKTTQTQMLVFRRGKWIDASAAVEALSDPIFTEGHRRAAAAVAGTWLAKGHSVDAAVAAAEKVLYEEIYKFNHVGTGSRGKSMTPHNTKKKSPV